MEPELHAWASRYTDDPNLAYALVHHTVLQSCSGLNTPDVSVTTRSWMAELMWRAVTSMACFRTLEGPAPGLRN